MNIFKKALLQTPTPSAVPSQQQIDTERERWWNFYSSLIDYALDDAESLFSASHNPHKIAGAAARIADAAFDAFEERWRK